MAMPCATSGTRTTVLPTLQAAHLPGSLWCMPLTRDVLKLLGPGFLYGGARERGGGAVECTCQLAPHLLYALHHKVKHLIHGQLHHALQATPSHAQGPRVSWLCLEYCSSSTHACTALSRRQATLEGWHARLARCAGVWAGSRWAAPRQPLGSPLAATWYALAVT